MTQDQLKEESLENTTRQKNYCDTMTEDQWEAYELNNTKSHQKQCLTMLEEKREHARAYDGEWHKICTQECNMEDCGFLDSCGISDEDVEIHCRELKQYAIQIETNAKVYGFQDEDSVFDSDFENDELNPCGIF